MLEREATYLDFNKTRFCGCSQKAHTRSGAAFTIGVVGKCLSKSVVAGKVMGLQCKSLVIAAAPKDVRAYYSTETSNALMQAINDMQAATGIGPLLVDETSSVTVSGWLALACIISLGVVSKCMCVHVLQWG